MNKFVAKIRSRHNDAILRRAIANADTPSMRHELVSQSQRDNQRPFVL
jgi:hypothetical protein